jgi:hypothetical protein
MKRNKGAEKERERKERRMNRSWKRKEMSY